MTYTKLTRNDGTTSHGMWWDIGVTNRATGDSKRLCTDGVLHVYDTPEQAAFMGPTHVIDYPRAWEVESDDEGVTDGTKRGIKWCTVVREIDLPELTTEQRVEIAIRVSLLVYRDQRYIDWATAWLSGEDRSLNSARTAAHSAYVAAYETNDVSAAARSAANAAANAADAGAHAEAREADAAVFAAHAVANAFESETSQIDLASIIRDVLSDD